MTRFMLALLVCFIKVTPLFGAKDKLQVVVSFSILKDIVSNIAADHANVITIVGPNQDTHIFQPTPETSKLLLQADAVIMSGFSFEKWLEQLITAAGYKGPIVVASQGIKPIMLRKSFTIKNSIPDPHVWNSIANMRIWVNNIAEALSTLDPKHKRVYHKNAQAYLVELNQLDAWIQDQFKNIDHRHRKVITAHDAFGYYGFAYGIKFLAPMGMTTETEPSAFVVATLIKQIRREHISTLFVENMTNDRLIKQISHETGVKIGGTLYSDALSQRGEPGDSYIKMMQHNTKLFKQAMSESSF
jgi:zinc/manganese transport system substrate-binding protein